jgi:hypothetical protein
MTWLLWTVKSAAINMYRYLYCMDIGSGVAKHNHMLVLFLLCCKNNLHCHQQYMKFPISPHSHHHFFVFLMIVILPGDGIEMIILCGSIGVWTRALYLLGKCFTTWAMPAAICFSFVSFRQGPVLLPGLALKWDPPISASWVAQIIDMGHHAQKNVLICISLLTKDATFLHVFTTCLYFFCLFINWIICSLFFNFWALSSIHTYIHTYIYLHIYIYIIVVLGFVLWILHLLGRLSITESCTQPFLL